TPQIFGSINPDDPSWAISVKFDAGRYGFPRLDIRLDVATSPKEGQPYTRAVPHDEAHAIWRLPPPGAKSHTRVSHFEVEPFAEWLQRETTPELLAIRQVAQANQPAARECVTVISCRVANGEITQFKLPDSHKVLPEEFASRFRTLVTRREKGYARLLFFVKLDGAAPDLHISLLQQRIREDKGTLSQYWDTNGQFIFKDIVSAPTVNEIGDGMYLLEDKKNKKADLIAQLPKMDSFTPVELLRVYTSITAVREAHHLLGSHAEFLNIQLGCFIKRIPFLLETGKISYRPEHYLVYVRLPSGDTQYVTPEVGLPVSIEWIPGLGQKNSAANISSCLCSGWIQQRPQSEFDQTRTDFCVLIHCRPGHNLPRTFDSIEYRESLQYAEMTVKFNVKLQEAQLRGVKRFCESTHPPTVRLRNLLMAGKKSNHTWDIRGPNPSAERKQRFADAVQDARTRFNPSQASVIERLASAQDSTCVVEGPPGTGKTSVASS
ncbi:MAG: hypothetical protein Q9224_006912, partial [Gallowayella concinna]